MNRQIAIRQLGEISKHGKKIRLAAEGWRSQWQTLIAISLSARTRDEVTIEVCKKLFKYYDNVSALAKAKLSDISQIIKPVNFYKNKSRNIINCSQQLVDRFGSVVPHSFNDLTSLPGVGRKTANVFLSECKYDTIGVDTHVSYIAQRLNWVNSSDPHKIEIQLEKLFPKSHWRKINLFLVRFGKTYTSRRQKEAVLDKIRKIN